MGPPQHQSAYAHAPTGGSRTPTHLYVGPPNTDPPNSTHPPICHPPIGGSRTPTDLHAPTYRWIPPTHPPIGHPPIGGSPPPTHLHAPTYRWKTVLDVIFFKLKLVLIDAISLFRSYLFLQVRRGGLERWSREVVPESKDTEKLVFRPPLQTTSPDHLSGPPLQTTSQNQGRPPPDKRR